jgi:hypothetical protein
VCGSAFRIVVWKRPSADVEVETALDPSVPEELACFSSPVVALGSFSMPGRSSARTSPLPRIISASRPSQFLFCAVAAGGHREVGASVLRERPPHPRRWTAAGCGLAANEVAEETAPFRAGPAGRSPSWSGRNGVGKTPPLLRVAVGRSSHPVVGDGSSSEGSSCLGPSLPTLGPTRPSCIVRRYSGYSRACFRSEDPSAQCISKSQLTRVVPGLRKTFVRQMTLEPLLEQRARAELLREGRERQRCTVARTAGLQHSTRTELPLSWMRAVMPA